MPPSTLTLKIINDQNILDSFPKEKQLTPDQKELIRFIVKMTIEEYSKQQKMVSPASSIGMANRVLRLPEVEKLTGISRSTIYNRITKNDFPKSIKLGPHSVGWRENDINLWLEERANQ